METEAWAQQASLSFLRLGYWTIFPCGCRTHALAYAIGEKVTGNISLNYMVPAHLLVTRVHCKAFEGAAWTLLLMKILGYRYRRFLNHN